MILWECCANRKLNVKKAVLACSCLVVTFLYGLSCGGTDWMEYEEEFSRK